MLDRITPPEVRPFGHLSLPPMKRIVLDNGICLLYTSDAADEYLFV